MIFYFKLTDYDENVNEAFINAVKLFDFIAKENKTLFMKLWYNEEPTKHK